ncbi:hypothetical protein NL676_005404 [Syzygium grande]|nr:hypothetical protein NL676_005404 [Syzygium grande]
MNALVVQGFAKSLTMTMLSEVGGRTFCVAAAKTVISAMVGWAAQSLDDDDLEKKQKPITYFSPVFLKLATISLAAGGGIFGVVLGGIVGQVLCTVAAVIGRKSLASRISERLVTLLGENFMYYQIAKEIWDALHETYSNKDNTLAIFEIKGILHDLRQGESSVTDYFNQLMRHWQQLDMLEDMMWSCPEDSKRYKQIQDQERIYKFLLGLNKELDEVLNSEMTIGNAEMDVGLYLLRVNASRMEKQKDVMCSISC